MKRFLENRDIFFKKIQEIREEDGKLVVVEKDKNVVYHIIPFISDIDALLDSVKEDHAGLVVYNTADNFKQMKAAWAKLVKLDDFVLYFVNPFSKTEKRWIIRPKTHHFISDKSGLVAGLKAMFETVEATTEDEVRKIVKD